MHFVSHKNNLKACHQAHFLGARFAKNCYCGRGFAPDPAGELTALLRPLAGKGDEPHGGKGIIWSERKGKGGKGWKEKGRVVSGRRGEKREKGGRKEKKNGEGEWRGGEGSNEPPSPNPGSAAALTTHVMNGAFAV